MTNTRTIELGEYLFEFENFDQWVNKAKSWFEARNLDGKNSHLSIDDKGRICRSGREMARARDDNSFPVKVYMKVF